MKKILALLIASALSAETFVTDCQDNTVFLATPCLSFGVDLNILYLQPSSSNHNYSIELATPKWKIHEIHPKYNLGYEFGLSAFFHERSTEADLNYIHYRSHEDDKTEGLLINQGTLYTFAKGHASYSFDAGHFDYGILINCGTCLKTNLYGGIGLVRLKQKIKTVFTNSGSFKSSISSKFSGIGPEFGFDFSYGLQDGFQIVGKATGTLFIGRIKNHLPTVHCHHRKEILPGLEGKAGFAYTFKLGDCICSFIGGYQILYYLNAIQTIDTNFLVHSRHFSLAGPYGSFDVAF